jgi:hypothetical protein
MFNILALRKSPETFNEPAEHVTSIPGSILRLAIVTACETSTGFKAEDGISTIERVVGSSPLNQLAAVCQSVPVVPSQAFINLTDIA